MKHVKARVRPAAGRFMCSTDRGEASSHPQAGLERAEDVAKGRPTGHLIGATRSIWNQRNWSNSTKTTRGDCNLPVVSRGVVEVKTPLFPRASCSKATKESPRTVGQQADHLQDSYHPPVEVAQRPSSSRGKSKILRRVAQIWLRRVQDNSKRSKSIVETFDLEPLNSKINSSFFDDPPYEKDEISLSGPLNCATSANKKCSWNQADTQQNNASHGNSEDSTNIGDSVPKMEKTRFVEGDGENVGFGLCGLCLKRTKRTQCRAEIEESQVSLQLEERGCQRLEALPDNAIGPLLRATTFSTPNPGGEKMSETGTGIKEAGSLPPEERASASPSEPGESNAANSYSSGPESEQLGKYLLRLERWQGRGLLSAYADDINDWSETQSQIDSTRISKMKQYNQAVIQEQFNCGNGCACETPVDVQACALQAETILLKSQPQPPTRPNCLSGGTSTPDNRRHLFEDVNAKSNLSLPGLPTPCDTHEAHQKIASLNSFFDEFPCAEAMWSNQNCAYLGHGVHEESHHVSSPLSQTTYVITKIDFNEFSGPGTYSIASSGHIGGNENVVSEHFRQRNNNATDELHRGIDFALPGAVRKNPPLLNLIKEARAANLIPPSLPTPSYSWEKNETPDDDCMTLPARRPKEPKSKEGECKTSAASETAEVIATKIGKTEEQANQNSTIEPNAPSIQSIIETMQKVKSAEAQLRAKKGSEREKMVNLISEKQMTSSQAMESAKSMSIVNYKERRRLRHQKEIEEARKELLEATRSALNDRIAFNKKESKITSSSGVSETLFCGSTKAMFNPDAPLEDAEKPQVAPEKVIEKPVEDEQKQEPSPCPVQPTDMGDKEDKPESSRVEETTMQKPKPHENKKTARKKIKQVNKDKHPDGTPAPNTMQILPLRENPAQTPQNPSSQSQMFVPVPINMLQYGTMLPFGYPQPNFYYIQNPWESVDYKTRIPGVYISETSSSGSSSPRHHRPRGRSERSLSTNSSSFSSFSETSSFSSDSSTPTSSERSATSPTSSSLTSNTGSTSPTPYSSSSSSESSEAPHSSTSSSNTSSRDPSP